MVFSAPRFGFRRAPFAATAALAACAAVCAAPSASYAQAPPPMAERPQKSVRPVSPSSPIRLFNGRDFSGLYTFLPSKGVNNDPDHIFTVEPDGIMHVLGKEFGYFATVVPYANYHLTFEVKWGEKKWPPRDGAKTPRDSGCLVHCFGPDKVWQNSFECQVQENDMGDIFLIGGVSAWANGKRQNGRVVRNKANEKPNGQWNTVEIICKDDTVTNIVNGFVESEATRLTRKQNGAGGKLNFGTIAFQSEGAEVFYRNIIVKPLP